MEDLRIREIEISEAVLIATTPFFAYVLCYLFEIGYCNYFELPASLIEINIFTVLNTLAILLLIGILIRLLFWGLSELFEPAVGFLPLIGKIIGVFIITYIVLSIILGDPKELFVALIILFGGTIIFIFLIYLLYKIRRKTYNAQKGDGKRKLPKDEEIKIKTLLKIKIIPFKISLSKLILILLLSLGLSYATGYGCAKRRSSFTVINTEPEKVVLRIYGGKVICAEYDRENKVLKKRFFALYLTENRDINFEQKDIGPLNP